MSNTMLDHAKNKIEDHPNFREGIIDLYDLAQCEVEGGGSYENEFMHMRDSIEDLIEGE